MTRIEQLKQRMAEQNLAAGIVVPGPNFFYLTGLGMRLSERITMVVFTLSGDDFVVCPQLEAEKIRRITGIEKIYPWSDEEGPKKAATEALVASGLKGKKVAMEFGTARLLEWDLVRNVLDKDVEIENFDEILEGMRAIKDQDEIALMEKAVVCVEEALKAAQAFMKPGVKENEVSALIEATIRKFGGTGGGSVISGERGCLPHAITSDKELEEGDGVIIDIVAKYQGYTADITRTFAIGKLPAELEKIYNIVYQAQAHARAKSKPGMTGEELDALARDKITEAGYGEYFIHRTGHGLGIETHEAPYVVKGNHVPFEVGNAFTIEPGIYVPGLGGVRIEDDAVMVPGGVRILTGYPRELIVLPVD
ncbi:MAG: aminopeptidase P family protein [Firmicutes bacterium]|nr:aminopeptidase P family protein [Bacillota bacterium]